jgi:hypothetical protein
MISTGIAHMDGHPSTLSRIVSPGSLLPTMEGEDFIALSSAMAGQSM